MDSRRGTAARVGMAAANPDPAHSGIVAHLRAVGFRSLRIDSDKGWALLAQLRSLTLEGGRREFVFQDPSWCRETSVPLPSGSP